MSGARAHEAGGHASKAPRHRLALALWLGLLAGAAVAGEPLAVGDRAPDWRLQRPSGETVNFYADAGNGPAVVLFWATWCPYCRALMPHLQDLAERYAGKPVRFYALNVWEDGDPVAHMAERGYTFDLLLEADAVAEAWGVQGTPGLLVVDGERRVRYTRTSGTAAPAAEAAVADALEAALADRGEAGNHTER